jgi:hypothetical protein
MSPRANTFRTKSELIYSKKSMKKNEAISPSESPDKKSKYFDPHYPKNYITGENKVNLSPVEIRTDKSVKAAPLASLMDKTNFPIACQ